MDNYSGLNVATRVGEGDANILGWKNLDAAADRVYKEQKANELLGQKHYAETMDALGKNFAKVRTADIPEITSSYNKLNELQRQYHFGKNVDKLALQQAINLENQNYWAKVGESLDKKKQHEQFGQFAMQHPELVKANYDAKQVDATKSKDLDFNAYRDNTPYGDLQGVIRDAMGTPVNTIYGRPTIDKDGYTNVQQQVSRGNNLMGFNNSLASGIYKSPQIANRAIAEMRGLMSTPEGQQELAQTAADFQKIDDTRLEKMGVTREDLKKIVQKNPDNLAEAWTVYQTMKAANNNALFKDVDAKRWGNKPDMTVANHKAMKLFDLNLENNQKLGLYKFTPTPKDPKYATYIDNNNVIRRTDNDQPYNGENLTVDVRAIPPQAIKDIRSGTTEDGHQYDVKIDKGADGVGYVKVKVIDGQPVGIPTVITRTVKKGNDTETEVVDGGDFVLTANKKQKIVGSSNTTKPTSSSKQQTGKSSIVTYVDGGVTYNIPADKEASFLKAKPKAKKQ